MSIIAGISVTAEGIKEVFVEQKWLNYRFIKDAKPDKAVLTIPAEYLTFRTFNVPFTDRKKVSEVIREELSHSILFFNNAVWDFTKTGDNQYFVVAAEKDKVKSFLERSARKIDVAEAEPFSAARYVQSLGYKDFILVDFGSSRTLVITVKDEKLTYASVILKGYNDLIKILRERSSLSEIEARKIMTVQGTENAVVKEQINNIMEFLTIRNREFENVLLYNESYNIKGFSELLKGKFRKDITQIKHAENINSISAAGIALKKAGLAEGVNLILQAEAKEKFSVRNIIILVVMILIFSADLMYKENFYKKKYTGYLNSLKEGVKEDFAGMEYKNSLSQVKQIVSDEELIYEASEYSPLEVLSRISSGINGGDFRFFEINCENNMWTLSGETGSIKKLNSLKDDLKNDFREVVISEVKSDNSGKINFQLKVAI